jgi:hypothetical protein
LDNLQNRNVLVVKWCCMCKKYEESIDHLLFHHEVVTKLCSALFSCLVLLGLYQKGERVVGKLEGIIEKP